MKAQQPSWKKKARLIHLGGIWKGIKISEKEIKKARKELLKKIEERWGNFSGI